MFEEVHEKESVKETEKSTWKKSRDFGMSLVLSNVPMSPKLINGSYAAFFDNMADFAKVWLQTKHHLTNWIYYINMCYNALSKRVMFKFCPSDTNIKPIFSVHLLLYFTKTLRQVKQWLAHLTRYQSREFSPLHRFPFFHLARGLILIAQYWLITGSNSIVFLHDPYCVLQTRT